MQNSFLHTRKLIDPENSRRYYYNYKWQVLCEYNGSDEFQQWYAYGNYIDEVLAMGSGIFASTARFYIHDHLYSPVALTDYSGNVLERYEYDAYGNPYILDTQYAPRTTSNYGNPYLFTGRRADYLDSGSLKIQYNRNRYYDYYTGRWLTHDPLGITPNPQLQNRFDVYIQHKNGINLYEYAKSDPVNFFDMFGTSPVDCGVTWHRSQPRLISILPPSVSVGHDWLEYSEKSMGFWPSGSMWFSRGVVKRPDPYHWIRSGKNWLTRKSESCFFRKLRYGKGKGKKCKCATCDEVRDCLEKVGDVWDGKYFILLFRNYRHFVRSAINNCCLYTDKRF